MTRAAWKLTACMLSLAPLAMAQEFPTPASMPHPGLRYAQAPVVTPIPPQPPLPPEVPPTPVANHAIAAPKSVVHTSMSELAPTPEMWFYEREREEYADPRNAVRAAAELKGEQRRRRLASTQWFGYSNSRPKHAFTPFTTTASPQWGSNSADPYIWSGVGRSATVVVPGTPVWR